MLKRREAIKIYKLALYDTLKDEKNTVQYKGKNMNLGGPLLGITVRKDGGKKGKKK